MRRRFLPLPAALALVAAGCGGGDSGEPAQRTETAVVAQERSEEDAPAAEGAQADGPLRLARVGEFASPLYVTAPPGDRRRLFVVEQGGRIRVVRGGRVLRRPFLDVSAQIVSGGEQGLLGLAFAPDYARSRRFYVNFTNRSGDTRIVEYRARRSNPDRADPGSARVLLRQDQPEANHNGGMLAFGPDRLLYIGLGDGGGGDDQHGERGNAQDLGSLLGKILRIDPRRAGSRPYRVPGSNPFVGREGARPEVFAYGLRNPWRFSFDRETSDLVIGDVGQSDIEEISFATLRRARGANFGWRPWEGNRRNFDDEEAPGHLRPVIEKSHDDGYCSITGGYVVRAPDLPALRGQYVYGDFCDGKVRAARLRSGGASNDRALDLPRVGPISSFGEDAQGRVYVTSLDGPVYRLTQG
ncbi:MAG TPA: PQQ-dependent sugar dehydrogenase [Solirubrobacteraceae bacterium]|nr:PQQ-dependent sugar dehydrogenase [Solirubrobacteraceae bacterium]